MKGNWIGHILRKHCLLKYVIEGKIEGTKMEEEEDVSSYWMNSMIVEDTGTSTRKHEIALCRELALEEAVDPSWD
jgi:hypothetical protein